MNRVKRLKKKLRRANARRERRNAPQPERPVTHLTITGFPLADVPCFRYEVVFVNKEANHD